MSNPRTKKRSWWLALPVAAILLAGCSGTPAPPVDPTPIPETSTTTPTTEVTPTDPATPETEDEGWSQQVPQNGAAPTAQGATPEAKATALMEFVVRDADAMWSAWFADVGFTEPTVKYAFINQPFYDECSKTYVQATTQNAYYCGINDTIELPVTTMANVLQGKVFQDLNDPRLTNFVVAFIVAHEFGHNIHQELQAAGVKMTKYLTDVGDSSKELFADCTAGVWAFRAYYNGNLEPGDIESGVEGMAAMSDSPGDDPRTPHGTADQRVRAFNTGYNTGQPYACMHTYLGVA